MSDYIKREDAIQSVIAHDALKDVGDSRGYAEWLLNKAPSADVAPVRHGRWVEREVIRVQVGFEMQSQRCSNCGKYHTTPYMYCFNDYNYCPWCGARMEGDGE